MSRLLAGVIPPSTTTTAPPPTTAAPLPVTTAPVPRANPTPAPRYHPPATSAPTTSIKTQPQSQAGWNTANASWYGPGFYGHGTACGQRYSSTILGVAHKSLPCGTQVTFEYQGRIVTAPVIDRGPYIKNRTWDLSRALCERLNHCFTGAINYRF